MAKKEKEMTMEELEKEIDSKEKDIARGRAVFMACKKRLAQIKKDLQEFDVTDIEKIQKKQLITLF